MNNGKKQPLKAQRMRTIVKASVNDDGIIWVNGHRVNMLTGWDKRHLEYMREEGIITYMKEGKKVKYDLESVHRYWEKMKKFDSTR
jgi:hypothetical protein